MLVFGPAGVALTAIDELRRAPDFAARGRERFGTQVANAKVLGQLALAMGRRALDARLAGLTKGAAPAPREHSVESPGAPAAAGSGGENPQQSRSARSPGVSSREEHDDNPTTSEAVDRAIPGYAALSASQVIPRLDSLGVHELEAVYRHEAATRRRRTILHRTQQLLGREHPPAPDD